jgi:hypothetical protein
MNTPARVALAALIGVVVGVCGSTLFSKFASARRQLPTSKELSPLESQQRFLAQFATERRDPLWADRATSEIKEWFERAAKRGVSARLERIECHTASCVASLTWDQSAEIKKEVTQLLQISGVSFSGCVSQLYVNNKDGPPYRGPLILSNCRQ